jgi:uncharacterized membrane protein
VLGFVIWFGFGTLAAWRDGGEGGNLARAATLVIMVVLVHSLVEYPLRTAAIGSIFAACCAFLLPGRSSPTSRTTESSKEQPTLRHVEAD